MIIASIIFAALLTCQFVVAIDRKCHSLATLFAVEILLFAYIAQF